MYIYFNLKKIFEVKIGTAIPLMKDIYGSKITEEYTFSKGLGLCIEYRLCKQEK